MRNYDSLKRAIANFLKNGNAKSDEAKNTLALLECAPVVPSLDDIGSPLSRGKYAETCGETADGGMFWLAIHEGIGVIMAIGDKLEIVYRAGDGAGARRLYLESVVRPYGWLPKPEYICCD